MSDIPSLSAFNDIQSALFKNAQMQQVQKEADGLSGKEPLTPERRAELAKAAKGFESMFISMMMKQMKSSMLEDSGDHKDEDGGSLTFGADTLQGYTDMQFADFATNKGGLGLARQIYEHLTGGEQLPMLQQFQGIQSPLPIQNYSPARVSEPTVSTEAPSPAHLPQNQGNFLDRVSTRLKSYDPIIRQAAATYNVPVSLIKGVITAESAGRPTAQSGVGAKGLMQLMDTTAQDLGVEDSFDPQQNIFGGAKYLQQMLKKFNGDQNLAIAAYNAGPGNVQKYNGIPPFKETQAYVRNVQRYTEFYNIMENTSIR